MLQQELKSSSIGQNFEGRDLRTEGNATRDMRVTRGYDTTTHRVRKVGIWEVTDFTLQTRSIYIVLHNTYYTKYNTTIDNSPTSALFIIIHTIYYNKDLKLQIMNT